MVSAKGGNQLGAGSGVLRALGFKPGNGHIDLTTTQFEDGLLKNPGSGEVDIDCAICFDHYKTARIG